MADKFTRKSQEALADAVRRATAEGNPHVDPLHLLVALIRAERRDGRPLLQAIGADPPPCSPSARDRLAKLPSAAGAHAERARHVAAGAGVAHHG